MSWLFFGWWWAVQASNLRPLQCEFRELQFKIVQYQITIPRQSRGMVIVALRVGYATNDSAWKYKLLPIKNATGHRDCYLDINQRRALIVHAPADLACLLWAMSLIPLRPGAVAALTVSN